MKETNFWDIIINKADESKARGAWEKGVRDYAVEIAEAMKERAEYDKLDPKDIDETEAINLALNGADNWKHYSWSGNSLIYDGDICNRMCSPSMVKRYKGGELPPNSSEQWLDVQGRALFQAWLLVKRILREVRAEYLAEATA